MCQICSKLGVNIHENGAVDATVTDPHLSLDPFAGDTYRGKSIFNLDQIVPQIDSGMRLDLSDNIITWGFYDAKHATGLYNHPSFGEGYGYSPFTEAQRASARDSIGLWDDLIPLQFVEVSGPGASERTKADILLANTTTGPAQAWAYYPGYGAQYKKVSSDAWIADPSVNGSNGWLRFGGYGDTTLIHELGHAVGLSHPGSYNYDPNLPLSYRNYAEYAQDSKQYSIMSYWSDRETNGLVTTWNVFLAGQPQTPMLHDIVTIQSIYGADPTTRATDTVYGFNSNAGRDVYDFTKNPYPMLSIYDAGGNDTIDLSGFGASQFIDLHPGSFSSIGALAPSLSQINADRAQWNADSGSEPGDPYYLAPIAPSDGNLTTAGDYDLTISRVNVITNRIAATTGVSGIRATEFKNVSIAYGTTIENAIGGSARDLMWGNAVANTLDGRGGDDVIDGFEGADTYIGGDGNDSFVFRFVEQGDKIMDFASGDKIDVSKIDAIAGTSANDAFTYIGSAAFSNVAGQLRYDGGVVQGDVNGDGVADFTVLIANNASLVASDFIL